MPLPYASDSTPHRRPTATLTLLALNILLTLGMIAGEMQGRWHASALLAQFGIVPDQFRPYTLLTYSFFHAGLGHLLLNVFYLWLFGGGVEDAVGPWRFVLLYLLAGAFGGALQALVTVKLLSGAAIQLPIVGASAACAGLIGLYAARYYRARLSFVLLPFRPHVVTVVMTFLAYEIGAGLWGLLHGAADASVAHWAHIGGFIFGLGCAQAMRLSDIGERAYLTEDAAKAMNQSVPGAAIDRWEQLLAREPQNAQARAELARAWLLLGDLEQAAEQYTQAITTWLNQGDRIAAAQLYLEMTEHGLEPSKLAPGQLHAVGNALEELEQFMPAADALRRVALRYPDESDAEIALLKVATLYVHRLNRHSDALALLQMHSERYPHTAWRTLADDLRRAATA